MTASKTLHISQPLEDHRDELQAKWSKWVAPTEYEGEPTLYAGIIEARLKVDPKRLPLTGVIGLWSLRKSPDNTVAVIGGYCLQDNTARGFGGGSIRTSVIVKIEDGFAVTLNSVYRLLSDSETHAAMSGELEL